MLTSRRLRILLIAFIVVVLVMLFLAREPLLQLFSTTEVSIHDIDSVDELNPPLKHVLAGPKVHGTARIKKERRGRFPVYHGRVRAIYSENGTLALDQLWRNNVMLRSTVWDVDGTVLFQTFEPNPARLSYIYEPPWLWGIDDEDATSR